MAFQFPQVWWEVKNKTKFGGGCEKHYSLLKDEDLFDLKPYINDISDDNCAMFMWCVSSKLDVAINMMEHWGFKYKTMPFVWVKTYPKKRRTLYESWILCCQ